MMPELLIILGIAGYVASLVVAYVKGMIKKQLIFVAVLLFLWYVMFLVKIAVVKAGMTQDVIGLPRSTLIELVVGYIYPYTIAPLIAIMFAVFKKGEAK